MPKFEHVICASFVRCKITYSVCINRSHEIIFFYKQMRKNK
jgi:hypothetical protein